MCVLASTEMSVGLPLFDLEHSVGNLENSLTRLLNVTAADRHADPTGSFRRRLANTLRRLRDALVVALDRVIEDIKITTQNPQRIGFGDGAD